MKIFLYVKPSLKGKFTIAETAKIINARLNCGYWLHNMLLTDIEHHYHDFITYSFMTR